MCLKDIFLLQNHTISLWIIGIRPQSERNILFEYRFLNVRM